MVKELNHETYMKRAIELSAKAGIHDKTGGCFGAVIVDKETGEIVGEGYNQVIAQNDPTWHGEMEALRDACKKRGSPHVQGTVCYTSAQPCPMCYTAIMWARVDHVYYGARYEDVMEYGRFEDADFLGELKLPEDQRKVKCEEIQRDEACEVWKQYRVLADKGEVKHY